MLLPRFEFHEPKSFGEASRIMAELGPEAKMLAGGTDLLVNMKRKVLQPKHLVSLSRVEGGGVISVSNDHVTIGCQVTASEIAESKEINDHFKILAEGAAMLGTPLVRNMATVAGNVVTARPAADTLPPLIALGAQLTLESQRGERQVELLNFVRGPGQTVINPDEVLTKISIRRLPDFSGGAYIKLGLRKTLEISLVNVASVVMLDRERGAITEARIVMGAVGPTPLRAYKAEEYLKGAEPGEEAFMKAGEIAASECKPITDHRGSAEYRQWMVAVLTKRALVKALERAHKSKAR